MIAATTTHDGNELLTNKDLQAILHMSKNQVYELQKSSCFPTIRINNRMYVTRKSLSAWLDSYTGRTYKL